MSQRCSREGCKAWAKRGTDRCVFHPLEEAERQQAIADDVLADVPRVVVRGIPSVAPTARCNVCRSPIPAGRAGCPNPWMHSPGYVPRNRR